jgi:predicted secreted protein
MNLFLGLAIYLILWWLVFFMVLPLGARSLHEADETGAPGIDRGAPVSHNLGMKALVAAAIAAVLWLGVAWAISRDLFDVFPD